jgi:glycoside/pentoside/hexuronide:cation symporter, GPH family
MTTDRLANSGIETAEGLRREGNVMIATAEPLAGGRPVAGRLSGAGLMGFAAPGLCIGALSVAVSVYLTNYYAAHFGLGLSAVGLAFMVLRLVDMLVDPMLGLAMDRTRTRLGRYRVWLLASLVVLVPGVLFLFDPPGRVDATWLVGWLAVYYLGLSMIVLSHAAWGSVMAAAYHERSRVFGAIQMLSIIGGALVLVIPAVHDPLLASIGLPRTSISAVGLMGWCIGLMALGGVALAAWSTPEQVLAGEQAPGFGIRDYLQMLLRPDMGRIVAAELCLNLGPGWMSALYLFFMRDVMGFGLAPASLLLLDYFICGVAGAATMSWVARRLGKHRTLMLVATLYSGGLMALALIPRGAFPLVFLQMSYVGFLAGSFPLLTRAMVADVGDAVRLELGSPRNGLLYSMITTSQKFGVALSIGVSFTLLGWVGYHAHETATNTPDAIVGLKLVFIVVPIIAALTGALCFVGYALDARRHDQIRIALEARDTQS